MALRQLTWQTAARRPTRASALPGQEKESAIDDQHRGEPQRPPGESHPRAPAPPPWAPPAGEAPPLWYPRPPTPPAPPRPTSWTWKQCFAGLLVGFGPEALLALAAMGTEEARSAATKVTVASALVLLVGALVMYGWQTFAAWLFSLRLTGLRFALWGFTRPSMAFLWTIPAALAGVYAVSFLYSLGVDSQQQDILSEFPRSSSGIVLFLLVAVVMAPLFEEIFFRGFLFRGFADSWGWVWGAVVSASVFGMAHLQLDVFVPLFALGFALAWVYKRTGSLWTSIALHALFNGLSVAGWWLLPPG